MNKNRDKAGKMFDLLMRIVIVYSFEKVKIKQKYFKECTWYENKNKKIQAAADNFLNSSPPQIDAEKIFSDTEHLEKEFKQELVRYFWNYHQYGFKPNNPDVFESLGYEQDKIHNWIIDTHDNFYPDDSLRDLNPVGFAHHYNIYSFLVPDQFQQIFFKYYQILKQLEGSTNGFLSDLISLVRLIPYYSPYSMQALTELESHRSQHLNKKHFSVFHNWFSYGIHGYDKDRMNPSVAYVSLDHQPIALIDTLLQFLLKHLHHLVHWHFFGEEMAKSNSEAKIQENIQIGEMKEFEQLDQVTKLLETMFTALPKNQKTIYDFVAKKKSTENIMHSLMLFDFESRYVPQHEKNHSMQDPNNIKGSMSTLSRKDKKLFNEAYFEFLREGFENVGIDTNCKIQGKFDEWELELFFQKPILISGSKIRSNAINHRELLNKNNILE